MGSLHLLLPPDAPRRFRFSDAAKRLELLKRCVVTAANDVVETGHGVETLRLMLTRLRAAEIELELVTGVAADEPDMSEVRAELREVRREQLEGVRDARLWRVLLAFSLAENLRRLPDELRTWVEKLARTNRRLERAKRGKNG